MRTRRRTHAHTRFRLKKNVIVQRYDDDDHEDNNPGRAQHQSDKSYFISHLLSYNLIPVCSRSFIALLGSDLLQKRLPASGLQKTAEL